MKPKKIPTSIRLDPVLKRKLELISYYSRGKPSLAGLIEEALERYTESVLAEDEPLRVKVLAELVPRISGLKVINGNKSN